MAIAYINIGANIGDRAAQIERAVALIEQALGATARRAPIIESEPWGYTSEHRFLNLGIAIDTTMEPLPLLRLLLELQQSIHPGSHREADGRTYADRYIDIDLIAIDRLVVDTPELTLPHPRMHLRPFVLEPMARLAPEWRHPITGLTPAEMLRSAL